MARNMALRTGERGTVVEDVEGVAFEADEEGAVTAAVGGVCGVAAEREAPERWSRTSLFVTRPSFPVPITSERLIDDSRAIRRVAGVARTLLPAAVRTVASLPVVAGDEAGAPEGASSVTGCTLGAPSSTSTSTSQSLPPTLRTSPTAPARSITRPLYGDVISTVALSDLWIQVCW